jgi:hypothetical protein
MSDTFKGALDDEMKANPTRARCAKAVARADAAEAKLKKAEEECGKQAVEMRSLKDHGTSMFDKACFQTERADAAEARVETLEKIIEDAPHSEHCALLPVRRELDYVVVSQRKCNCWKAAAALNAKP